MPAAGFPPRGIGKAAPYFFSLIMMKFIRWTDLAIRCPGRRPPRAFRLGTGISERLSLAGRGAL